MPIQQPLSSKKIISLLAVFSAILCIIAVVFLSVLSAQRSTESRSQASGAKDATFTLIPTIDADLQEFELVLEGADDTSSDPRSFRATIRLEATTSAVLGTTTIRGNGRDEHLPTQSVPSKNRDGADKRRVCFDAVEISGGQAVWTTPCRGNTAGTNCTGEKIPLTAEEKVRYDAWIALRKPQSSRCMQVPTQGTPQRSSVRAGSQTSPSLVPSTATSKIDETTPITAPLRFLREDITIESTSKAFILQEPTASRQDGTILITLLGERPSLPKIAVNTKESIATFSVSRPSPDTWYRATLIETSLKGTTTLAPGIEIELLNRKSRQ